MKFNPLAPFGTEVTGFRGSSEEITTLKERLLEDSLLVIRDTEISEDDALVKLAESLSFRYPEENTPRVLHWSFGPVMTMSYDPNAINYLFSDEEVPFHWDGAFHVEPQFLLFSCLESEGEGGKTLFANTEKIWNSLSQRQQENLAGVRLSFKTEKKAHYGGVIDVALVQSHPLKRTPILRFAEEVQTHLNPVEMKVHAASSDPTEALNLLGSSVRDPKFCYSHQWRRGDLVIADNFSLVHGRNRLGDNRSRKFKRVQIL